jgi:ketosteroid isomerase-like protein
MNENYESKIAELINKSDITSVVNSYFRALDEKDFSAQHLAAILTPQARITRPNGASLIGPEEVSASHEKSFARFEGSQHFLTGHDISVHTDTASVRANLIAMHIWQGSNANANNADNYFVAGGVIRAELVQTDGQWKMSQLRTDVVWRAGGFRDMMQTGR